MSWIFYAFICAILAAAALIIHKRTLIRQHAMDYSAGLAVVNLIFALPLFFIIDMSQLQAVPVAAIFFVTILGAVAFLLVSKSVRHMDVSEASPLLVLGPGITAALAFFILGERLSAVQVAGISVLILGAYVLELKSHHDLFHPMRVLGSSRYVYYIFVALVLYSICAVMDRTILSRYGMDPVTYTAVAHVFLAFHFVMMLIFFHHGVLGLRESLRAAGPWIFVAAILTFGYRFAQATAVKTAYVGLVTPIKRLSSFFVTLVGGEIFHEKNLLRKTLACLVMLCGVVMILM